MQKEAAINFSIIAVAVIAFLVLSFKYAHFTIDDGFIAFRYSDNLAEGYVFSWNYDQSREFGATSYLHVILVAAGIVSGFDAVAFNKILTVIAGLVTIVTVGFMAKELTNKQFKFYFISSLALALMPFFAIHAIAGLETTLFISLFTLSTYSYIRFLKRNNRFDLAVSIVFIIFCTFTRYEGILLAFGVIIHQIYAKVLLKESWNFRKFVIFVVPLVFFISLLVWNYYYFGQPLPNPFYVKKSTEISDVIRNIYELAAAFVFVIPHILLVLLYLRNNLKNSQTSYLIIQIIVAAIPFLFINQFINYFFRYYFHFVPILLVLSIFSLYSIKGKIVVGRYATIAAIFVVLLLVTYNLPTNSQARGMADGQSKILESSHIKIGKILGKYEELKNNTIGINVDAGAIPYYSKWKAYDYVLNDSYVVRHGFDVERYYSFEPKIMIINVAAQGYPQKSLPSLEGEILEFLSKPDPLGHVDEIVTHEKFKNYQLVTAYPKILIYVEKEFVKEHPDLINDLISNSTYLRI
jgi:hypothetical protein